MFITLDINEIKKACVYYLENTQHQSVINPEIRANSRIGFAPEVYFEADIKELKFKQVN
jgi:hypothetical protein